jgi:histidine triad (HIT) family protein
MNKCTFCQIISGIRPGTIVFKDQQTTAFRDIHPVAPSHVLIVPNKHISSVNEMDLADENLMGHLFTVARQIAEQEGIQKSGYRLIINNGPDANQTIFHIHMHLIGGQPMRYPMG